MKMSTTRAAIGALLVKSAISVSGILRNDQKQDLILLKKLWNDALWILTCNPSLHEVMGYLKELDLPDLWKPYVQVQQCVLVIDAATRELAELVSEWPQNIFKYEHRVEEPSSQTYTDREDFYEDFSNFSGDEQDHTLEEEAPESNGHFTRKTI